jgi:SAM-dependent methyltransferase
MGALSRELFGIPLSSNQYADRFTEVFDYRNTFYDRQPRFDLGDSPSAEGPDSYDFVVSSDVFEHVAPPHDQAFRNAYDMLKPNGVLVFTVPYEIDESAEHFPELYEYGLAEVGDRVVLVNRTRAGETQVFENLNFHRSGAGKALEMRVFSERMLGDTLAAAGFSSVKIYAENYRRFGIVTAESWSMPIAARKGPFTFGIDAMREVMEEWRDLRTRITRSRWIRIRERLGLFGGKQLLG